MYIQLCTYVCTDEMLNYKYFNGKIIKRIKEIFEMMINESIRYNFLNIGEHVQVYRNFWKYILFFFLLLFCFAFLRGKLNEVIFCWFSLKCKKCVNTHAYIYIYSYACWCMRAYAHVYMNCMHLSTRVAWLCIECFSLFLEHLVWKLFYINIYIYADSKQQ